MGTTVALSEPQPVPDVPAWAPAWFQGALADEGEKGFVEVEAGVRVEYLRWRPQASRETEAGRARAPPLVFMHGNGANAHWYAFLAPFFKDLGYDVVAISNSGCGASDWRPSYHVGHFADETRAVCAALGFFDSHAGIAGTPKPALVAHSLGGMVAMKLALEHGNDFAAIILCDTNLENAPDDVLLRNRKINVQKRSTRKEFQPRGAFKLHPPSVTPVSRFKLAPAQETTPYVLEYIANKSARREPEGSESGAAGGAGGGGGGWRWRGDHDRFRKLDLLTASPPMSVSSVKRALKLVPLAYVYGEHSFFITDIEAVKSCVKKDLPGLLPTVMVPNAAHHLLLDEPIAFVSVIQALLATMAPPVHLDSVAKL